MAGEGKGPSKTDLVAETLETHGPELRRFVGARVPIAHVDDVLQSAAVRAVERSGSLKNPECALAWVYRIHRNVITDTLRKRASQERMLDREAPLPDVGSSVADDPCACSVVQAQRLSPTYAEMLNLVDVGDASLPQAAEALGISINNATVRLHRARKALRKAMLDHCGVQTAQDCVECRCVFEGCCTA